MGRGVSQPPLTQKKKLKMKSRYFRWANSQSSCSVLQCAMVAGPVEDKSMLGRGTTAIPDVPAPAPTVASPVSASQWV